MVTNALSLFSSIVNIYLTRVKLYKLFLIVHEEKMVALTQLDHWNDNFKT